MSEFIKPTHTAYAKKFLNYPDFSEESWFGIMKVSTSSTGEEWSSLSQITTRAKRTHVGGDTYLFNTACAYYKVTFVDELPTHFRTLPEKSWQRKVYSALKGLTYSGESDYLVVSGTDDEGNIIKMFVDEEFPEYFDGQFRTGPRRGDGGILLK